MFAKLSLKLIKKYMYFIYIKDLDLFGNGICPFIHRLDDADLSLRGSGKSCVVVSSRVKSSPV